MVCPALLQGIFPTQGWNPGLPHWRQILYQLNHKGSTHKEMYKITHTHTQHTYPHTHIYAATISQASKVMLKILQARLQQYMNRELPGVQAGFRKGRGTRDQIANIPLDHRKSKRVPEKHLFLLY